VETLRLEPDRIDVVHVGFMEPPAAEPTPENVLRARHRLGAGPIVLSVAAARGTRTPRGSWSVHARLGRTRPRHIARTCSE
jgi:hypothetical protein